MEFLELQYFMAIAKHRNLTKAAQELYVSQPTLTKFLQKLEKEMGGKVFRKNGHRYELTFLGNRYLEYARKITTLNQDWEKELSDMRSSFEGELNIAFPPMRSTCLIPQFLPKFHEKHPGVHINFYEYSHGIQDELLADGKLDFAIFSAWQPHPNLAYENLKTEEILLVLQPEHSLAKKAVVRDDCRYLWLDLSLFKDHPFILHFPDQNTGRAAQQLFRAVSHPALCSFPHPQQPDMHPAGGQRTWSYFRTGKLCQRCCPFGFCSRFLCRRTSAAQQPDHCSPQKFLSFYICRRFYQYCKRVSGLEGITPLSRSLHRRSP